MAGTFAYTLATEVLEVTDGTVGTPATWNDAYVADLAATLTLLSAGTPAADLALDDQIQPAEELAQIISFTVANKTAEADHIFITGTDAWDGALTESIDVSAGDGAYVSTERFRTITTLDCSDNAAGGGTVWADGDLSATQGRWGVVWEHVADADYFVSANVHFGDGSTATYFQSKNEQVYFADGYIFQVEDNATLELGDLVGVWGVFGSHWSIGPSATMSLIPTGETAATFQLSDSTLNIRTGFEVYFRTGTVNGRNSTFSAQAPAGNRRFVFLNAPSLTRCYFNSLDLTEFRATPTAFSDCHFNSADIGIDANAAMTITDARITNATPDILVPGADTVIMLDPQSPVTSPSLSAAASILREDYTVNINVHDPDGDDLAGVTVLCERAHLMTGSDANVYRCTADIATAVDATHKPITGTDWADYWEVTDYASGGGDWTTGATYVDDEEEFTCETGPQAGIATDGTDGYIDLTTANNYLNDLRTQEFAIVSVFTPQDNTAFDRYVSSEGNEHADYPVLWDRAVGEDLQLRWSDAAAGDMRADWTGITDDETHSFVVVCDAPTTNGYGYVDGGNATSDLAWTNDLDAAQATLIRLGAAADDAGNKAAATFGPFFILDLTSVATVDAAFALSLATAINTACVEHDYDPDKIREAIVAVDGAIAGVYWKLDEAGTSGSFDAQTVIRYKVADGTVDAASGGTSSAAGCDGAVVGAEDGDIAEQQITVARWTGTSEIEERYEHTVTYSHASYPTFTVPQIVVAAPIDWEFNMGISLTDVLSANVVQVSGDATAADNLELQYDTTGLTGDTFPARQDDLGNLTSGTAAINTTAVDAPGGFVITKGANEANDEDSTHALDGVTHDLEDNPGDTTTDAYYIFSVGGNGVPVSITWQGYVQSQGDSYAFYAYNWGGAAWEQVGSVAASNGTTVSTHTFDLTNAHVGTGANIGLVHFRYYSTDGTKAVTDRVLCSYAVVAQSVGYALGAVWVDTVNGTAGTTPHKHGTADKPSLTLADALTIAGAVGLERLEMVNGSSIALTANSDNYTLGGHEWTLDLAGQSIANMHVNDATVTGVGTGSGAHFVDCEIGTSTLADATFLRCGFTGGSTLTMSAAGTYRFVLCYTRGPSPAPIFDYGAAVANTTAMFANWSGGLQVANLGQNGTDKINLHGRGKLTIAATCIGGTIGYGGHWTVTDNVGGGFSGTVNDDARYDVAQINAQADIALADGLNDIADALLARTGWDTGGATTVKTALIKILAACAGKITKAGDVYTLLEEDGATTAVTETMAAASRTPS